MATTTTTATMMVQLSVQPATTGTTTPSTTTADQRVHDRLQQLCEDLEILAAEEEVVEDHLEEAHLKAEVGDQSPLSLPKAQYSQLHLET